MSNLTRLHGVPHHELCQSRRDFLLKAGAGFGGLALTHLLSQDAFAAGARPAADPRSAASPLAPKPPHHSPKTKSVIFLFMEGGPSHLDLFDPKPKLRQLAGKTLPDSFGN